MRLIQTIAGTQFDHGGPSRSVPALCSALAAAGNDVTLVTSTCGAPDTREAAVPARLVTVRGPHAFGRVVTGWRFSEIVRSLLDEQPTQQQLLHDHGIWLASNHVVAQRAVKHGVIRVVSPRGMLSDWALHRGRLKKMLAWRVYQRRDLSIANAFHATSLQEAEEVRSLGFCQPIAVIPNGINFPEKLPKRKSHVSHCILFLSRVHPKKGLLNMLRAWRRAAPPKNWQLVIAGPDANGHLTEVRQLASDLQLGAQVCFRGPVADDEKWALYRSANIFVLPSFSENFGLVVGEALAAELPVITTTATPWRELQERNFGWWVDPSIDELARAISEATSLSDEQREVMGEKAAAWVRQRFSWFAVAQQMAEFYLWLLQGGICPPHVLPNVI